MKLNVGDKVKLTADMFHGFCKRGMECTVIDMESSDGKLIFTLKSATNSCTCVKRFSANRLDDVVSEIISSELPQLKENNDMSTINSKDIRVSKLGANQLKLYKAGFINEIGDVTDDGQNALWQILVDKHTDELIAVIDAVAAVEPAQV